MAQEQYLDYEGLSLFKEKNDNLYLTKTDFTSQANALDSKINQLTTQLTEANNFQEEENKLNEIESLFQPNSVIFLEYSGTNLEIGSRLKLPKTHGGSIPEDWRYRAYITILEQENSDLKGPLYVESITNDFLTAWRNDSLPMPSEMTIRVIMSKSPYTNGGCTMKVLQKNVL